MKLLTLANRYYFSTLLLVFIASGMASFFILKSIINREFNRKLFAEKEQLIDELATYDDLKGFYFLNIGDRLQIQEVPENPQIVTNLRDTVMYDTYEKTTLPFRKLSFAEQIKGKYYVITITKSLLPNQELIKGVSEILLMLILFLAISLVLINRYVINRLWWPFYKILVQLKQFNIKKPEPIQPLQTVIDEFRLLKSVLDTMVDKSIRDYRNLKEYTENTSHEIQTPLAIIKNKSESLLQETLTESQLHEVGKIYEAAGRLSRLKEGLSTLSKIDNNQFLDAEPIDIQTAIENKLCHFEELVSLKNIQVTTDFYSRPLIILNNDLAFILINNLVNNAIKHNVQGGRIHIVLKEDELCMENTGLPPAMPIEQLFDRFRSSGDHPDSSGLGLSLIKRIADFYQMRIRYDYVEGQHRVILNF
ncbi:MAG: HAMP domain-containing histidine kinase [Cyclobacteriaceae bacterium]|nr:HAMP domain-containing histidine kinase [Cyclobacteriaceae bacterium]